MQGAGAAGAPTALVQAKLQVLRRTQAAGLAHDHITLGQVNAQISIWVDSTGLQRAGAGESQCTRPLHGQTHVTSGPPGGAVLQGHGAPGQAHMHIAHIGGQRGGVLRSQAGLCARHADAHAVAFEHRGASPVNGTIGQRDTELADVGAQAGVRARSSGPLALGQINAQAIGRRHAGGAAQRKATHTRALDHDLACGRCERAGATGSQTAGDVHAHIALGLHRCCATPFNLAIGLQQHIAPSRQRAAACPRHHACAQHQTQVVCNRANAVGTHQDKITAVHLQQGFAGGLNSGALQHRLAVGAVQRQFATDRDEPQIDRVTVKHLDILRTLDAQVDPVVA